MQIDLANSFYSEENAQAAVRFLLNYIGDDPSRPGLIDTPERFLRAWAQEWGAGYKEPEKELVRLFRDDDVEINEGTPSGTIGQMVLVDNIIFHSHCEHHIAPFYGVAHVAYIPGPKGLVGISKLARIVDHFARRLQVQERLTMQVADFIAEHISPNVGVVLKARHSCMSSRGVRQPHAQTITSALKGIIFSEPSARAEFLALARASQFNCE